MQNVRILFLCMDNASRSPVAEAVTRHVAKQMNRVRADVFSAGGEPAVQVAPRALAALTAKGISVEGLKTKPVTDLTNQSFDYVVAIGDRTRESLKVPPGREAIYWAFQDPEAAAPQHIEEAYQNLVFGLLLRSELLLSFHLHAPGPYATAAELNQKLMRFATSRTTKAVERMLDTSAARR